MYLHNVLAKVRHIFLWQRLASVSKLAIHWYAFRAIIQINKKSKTVNLTNFFFNNCCPNFHPTTYCNQQLYTLVSFEQISTCRHRTCQSRVIYHLTYYVYLSTSVVELLMLSQRRSKANLDKHWIIDMLWPALFDRQCG